MTFERFLIHKKEGFSFYYFFIFYLSGFEPTSTSAYDSVRFQARRRTPVPSKVMDLRLEDLVSVQRSAVPAARLPGWPVDQSPQDDV